MATIAMSSNFESRFEEDNLTSMEKDYQAFKSDPLNSLDLPQVSSHVTMSEAADLLAEIIELKIKSAEKENQKLDDDHEDDPPLSSMINKNPYDHSPPSYEEEESDSDDGGDSSRVESDPECDLNDPHKVTNSPKSASSSSYQEESSCTVLSKKTKSSPTLKRFPMRKCVGKKPMVRLYRLSCLHLGDLKKNEILDNYLYAPVGRSPVQKQTEIYKQDLTGKLIKIKRINCKERQFRYPISEHPWEFLPSGANLVSQVSHDNIQFRPKKRNGSIDMVDAAVQFPLTKVKDEGQDGILVHQVYKLCPQVDSKEVMVEREGQDNLETNWTPVPMGSPPPQFQRWPVSRSESNRLVAISRHEIVSTMGGSDCLVKPLIYPKKRRKRVKNPSQNGEKRESGVKVESKLKLPMDETKNKQDGDESLNTILVPRPIKIESSDELAEHLKKFCEPHKSLRKDKKKRKRSLKTKKSSSPCSRRAAQFMDSIPSRTEIARNVQEPLGPALNMSKLLSLTPIQRLKYMKDSYKTPSSSPLKTPLQKGHESSPGHETN